MKKSWKYWVSSMQENDNKQRCGGEKLKRVYVNENGAWAVTCASITVPLRRAMKRTWQGR